MPLVSLKNAIAAAWTALTPPSDERRLYRLIEKPENGAGAHRGFYFRSPSGAGITEQGSTRHQSLHTFEAVVMLHVQERTSAEFEVPYREYQVLAPAVSRLRVERVAVPRVLSYRVEDANGEGDLDLILTIEARTKETSTA